MFVVVPNCGCSELIGNRSFRKRVVTPTASSQMPWVDSQTSDSDQIIIENGARFEFAFNLSHRRTEVNNRSRSRKKTQTLAYNFYFGLTLLLFMQSPYTQAFINLALNTVKSTRNI